MGQDDSKPCGVYANSRTESLAQLSQQRFDLLIIGGGITGAGIANEAAQRGLKVALVESEDFAAGTSSRSSKLIHGGLRYLAMGEVNLVRETALERKTVHAMAPHLAEPCWMVVPARSRAAMLKFRTAIGAYEKLGAVADRDRHQNWDVEALAVEEPALRSDKFPHACAYREYLTDDARLVLGVLRSAVRSGAVIANRLRADRHIINAAGRLEGIVVTNTLTDEELSITALVTVNAAGPWVERVLNLKSSDDRSDRGSERSDTSSRDEKNTHDSAKATTAESRIHLSKGVHIVVSADRLPAKNLVVLNTPDRRSIFVIPRGDIVYIGTTDTSYKGESWLWPEISAEDILYLLEPVARYFNVEPLELVDVKAAWAGLRPLVAQPGKEAKEISRKDEIWEAESGLITIAGGKLTGFRKMAISVVDRVCDADSRIGSASSETLLEPIPGGDFAGDLAALARQLRTEVSELSSQSADRLVRLYGTEAAQVLSLGSEPLGREINSQVHSESDSTHETHARVYSGEVRWAVEVEAAVSLEDVLYRRIRAAWYLPTQRNQLTTQIANQMATLLDWSPEHEQNEIRAVTQRFEYELAALAGPSPSSDPTNAKTDRPL